MSDIPTSDPKIERFRESFANSSFHLLEPVDREVNYSFEVMGVDPWTLELRADKWWFGETGRVENDTVTLNTYEIEDDEVQRETVREEALLEREDLLRIHATQGLGIAMQQAEEMADAYGYLDGDRNDPHLFTAGPEDRFFVQQEHIAHSINLVQESELDPQDRRQPNLGETESILTLEQDHPAQSTISAAQMWDMNL